MSSKISVVVYRAPRGLILGAKDSDGVMQISRYCHRTGTLIHRDALLVPSDLPEGGAEELQRRREALKAAIREWLGMPHRPLLETGEMEVVEGLTALG